MQPKQIQLDTAPLEELKAVYGELRLRMDSLQEQFAEAEQQAKLIRNAIQQRLSNQAEIINKADKKS